MTSVVKNMIRGNSGSVAAGFARALIALAERKGADGQQLCAGAGLDPDLLSDQDNRVPLSNYVRLMRAAKLLTNDPAFALHFGEAFETSELSIVGLIGSACQSVGEAFAALQRYERLVADVGHSGPRLVLERDGNDVWLVDVRRHANDFPELTESAFARMAHEMRRAPDMAPRLLAVQVTHPAPNYREEYDRIFQAPVTFAAARNALKLEGHAWLTAKLPLPSRYLFGVLSARAEALLKELEAATSVSGRVEGLLMPILHIGEADIQTIAARMGVSRQTLFRQLKAEGTSFEKVLERLRHRLALAYLADRNVSVNETAYLLGFSEPAAFSRAFKRWTGTSPRQARQLK